MKKNFLLFAILLAFQINSFSQTTACQANLVVNGDFEAGITGFTTQYQLKLISQLNEGEYNVTVIPNHGCFAPPDHTPTGIGNAMYVNGDTSLPKKIVWAQTVNVSPNTVYNFSSWVRAQCFNTSPAIIQFSINGVQIGPDFSPTGDVNGTQWEQFAATWNSGSNTTAYITIVDYNGATYGNDFGLDDISLSAPIQIASATPSNASCANATDGKITVTAKGGIPPYKYSINNGTSYIAGANPYTFTGLAPGTYVVKVKDNCGNEAGPQSVVIGNGNVISSCSITAVPCNNTYTGGIPTNMYLGYGPQSVTLKVTATGAVGYVWSGNGILSCTSCAAPVFTPKAAGIYNFTVVVTNNFGCKSTCSITICVTDIRVPESKGKDNGRDDKDNDHDGKGRDNDKDKDDCKGRDNDGRDDDDDNKKVYLCHRPPGNPGNPQELSISVNAVAAHLANHTGDRLGKCNQLPCSSPSPAPGCGPGSSIVIIPTIDIVPNPSHGQFKITLDDMKGSKADVTIADPNGTIIQRRTVSLVGGSNTMQFNLGAVLPGRYYVLVLSEGGVYTEKILIQ